MNWNKYNKQAMLNKYFWTIFVIDYNLVSFTDSKSYKTTCSFFTKKSVNIKRSEVNFFKKKKSV